MARRRVIESPFLFPGSLTSTPKSSFLLVDQSSKSLLSTASKSPIHRRVLSGPALPKRKAAQSPLRSSSDLRKGMKLLYQLYPLEVPRKHRNGSAFDEDSKVAQNLLNPVRMSLRIKRSSLRPGETDDVMSHIRRVFMSKVKGERVPEHPLSDIERLFLDSKTHTRRRKKRINETRLMVSTAGASPDESFLSPVNPAYTASSPVLSPIHSRCEVPRVHMRAHRPRKMLVDLPLLPFSQHKSYNEEKDFVRRHMYELNDDIVKDEEARRLLLSKNSRVKGPLRHTADAGV